MRELLGGRTLEFTEVEGDRNVVLILSVCLVALLESPGIEQDLRSGATWETDSAYPELDVCC
jgi:hypothetical protein